MLFSRRLKKYFHRLTAELTWPTMLLLVVGQTTITYILLVAAQETDIIHHPMQFFYYNMVVVSTVGFGDLSPVTDAGKAIVTFFQIPSGLIVFATFIGKITQLFINIARSNMNGSNNFSHLQGHILLLCWDEYSTEQVVKLILGDKKRQKRQILLCVTDLMDNPFPEIHEISFARVASFSDPNELNRIALSKAERIIVDGTSDDQTLSIALSIATHTNKDANISAHFFDKTKADLLKTHCPQIECSTDTSAQMMVRSMQDPGSSQVTERLLSTLNGPTLYCMQIPEFTNTITFGQAFSTLKINQGMILIGMSHFKNGDKMELNPAMDNLIESGNYLHYIANERVTPNEIDWDSI
jgi:voltage-gated potassium channel